MISYVALSRGMVAKVDALDLPLLLGYVWHAIPQGKTKWRARGYKKGDVSKKRVYMHTLLTGSSYIDHGDRDPLNNTRINLNTDATHSVNMRNVSAASNTGHVGISLVRGGRWFIAQISVGPRGQSKHYSKWFRTLEEAISHREKLVEEHFKCKVL